MNEKIFRLHYGPNRMDGLVGRKSGVDHPFGRLMPDEVVERLDEWVSDEVVARDIVLVEELPFIYLRYLIRKGDLESNQVHVYYHDGYARELRLGEQGELLDPWPGGFFDRSLEFTLGGF